MDAPKNGTNSLLLGIVVTLGIAAVTGVISWTFTHVVSMSDDVSGIKSSLISVQTHQTQLDEWVREFNRKIDSNTDTTRGELGKINDAVNEVLRRSDGKNH